MKSIEERAREYAGVHKATEFNYFGVGQVYGYERIYNAEITAYEMGAKEQKAIDSEKAKTAFNKTCGWLSTYPSCESWYNELFEEFIKNMEE